MFFLINWVNCIFIIYDIYKTANIFFFRYYIAVSNICVYDVYKYPITKKGIYRMSKPNRKKLREIMKRENLTAQDVATVLDRKLSTVQTWCAKTGVDIPDHSVALLHYKLEEMKIDADKQDDK